MVYRLGWVFYLRTYHAWNIRIQNISPDCMLFMTNILLSYIPHVTLRTMNIDCNGMLFRASILPPHIPYVTHRNWEHGWYVVYGLQYIRIYHTQGIRTKGIAPNNMLFRMTILLPYIPHVKLKTQVLIVCWLGPEVYSRIYHMQRKLRTWVPIA